MPRSLTKYLPFIFLYIFGNALRITIETFNTQWPLRPTTLLFVHASQKIPPFAKSYFLIMTGMLIYSVTFLYLYILYKYIHLKHAISLSIWMPGRTIPCWIIYGSKHPITLQQRVRVFIYEWSLSLNLPVSCLEWREICRCVILYHSSSSPPNCVLHVRGSGTG